MSRPCIVPRPTLSFSADSHPGSPLARSPTSIRCMVAGFGDFVSNFTGKPPPITPELAAGFGRHVATASAKAQRELGYRVVALNVMAKDCYDWLAAEGRI